MKSLILSIVGSIFWNMFVDERTGSIIVKNRPGYGATDLRQVLVTLRVSSFASVGFPLVEWLKPAIGTTDWKNTMVFMCALSFLMWCFYKKSDDLPVVLYDFPGTSPVSQLDLLCRDWVQNFHPTKNNTPCCWWFRKIRRAPPGMVLKP